MGAIDNLFRMFDSDDNGNITLGELSIFFRDLTSKGSIKALKQLVLEIHTVRDELIDPETFAAFVLTEWKGDNPTYADGYKELMDIYMKHNIGLMYDSNLCFISKSNLLSEMKNIWDSFRDRRSGWFRRTWAASGILVSADSDGNGEIDIDEFTRMLIYGQGAGGRILLIIILLLIYSRRQARLSGANTGFNASYNYTYKEIIGAIHTSDPILKLGEGGFGTVYRGELRNGQAVAVKCLNKLKHGLDQLENEISILSRVSHPNLISLFGYAYEGDDLLLVYEYVPNGTLGEHIFHEHGKESLLAWHTRLSIAVECADAFAHLHAYNIIHRDIKSDNILLDKNNHVKVADLGLSRRCINDKIRCINDKTRCIQYDVTHISTLVRGTLGYVDPDYSETKHLTEKGDVYSFGVVLMELISSISAYDSRRNETHLSSIAIRKIQQNALHELVDQKLGFYSNYFVRRTVTSVADLAYRCLYPKKDLRPSMKEVHNVLKGIATQKC